MVPQEYATLAALLGASLAALADGTPLRVTGVGVVGEAVSGALNPKTTHPVEAEYRPGQIGSWTVETGTPSIDGDGYAALAPGDAIYTRFPGLVEDLAGVEVLYDAPGTNHFAELSATLLESDTLLEGFGVSASTYRYGTHTLSGGVFSIATQQVMDGVPASGELVRLIGQPASLEDGNGETLDIAVRMIGEQDRDYGEWIAQDVLTSQDFQSGTAGAYGLHLRLDPTATTGTLVRGVRFHMIER